MEDVLTVHCEISFIEEEFVVIVGMIVESEEEEDVKAKDAKGFDFV